MKVFLSHNPYRIKSELLINGEKCTANWFRELKEMDGVEKRLQLWINDFFKAFNQNCQCNRFDFEFMGTPADCDDIESLVQSAEKNIGIAIQLELKPAGAPEGKFKKLMELYDNAKNGPIDAFKAVDLKKSFDEVKANELSVTVMAPMKAGKSTLLNSIIGFDLLPNDTTRATGKIFYIKNKVNRPDFQGKYLMVSDSGDIHENDLGFIPCDKRLLRDWNQNQSITEIIIEGHLKGIDSRNYNVQFIDTPGPDSAQHKEDKITIERYINNRKMPMVLFLLDIVVLFSDGAVSYLLKIAEHMKKFGKQSEDRFIFIVSRFDMCEFSNIPFNDRLKEIRKFLIENGIPNPRIFPVSGKIGMLARTAEAGQMLRPSEITLLNNFDASMQEFNLNVNELMPLSHSVRQIIESEMKEAIAQKAKNKEMLLLSGVRAVEASIGEYLIKYSLPARIHDAAEAFNEAIAKFEADKDLLNQIENQKNNIKGIGGQIEHIRKILVNGETAKEIKIKITQEQRSESKSFKDDLAERDRRSDTQIRERINEFTQSVTHDSDGYADKGKVCEAVQRFGNYLDELVAEMIVSYTNTVEDECKEIFKAFASRYADYVESIIGEMPPELKNLLKKFKYTISRPRRIDVDRMVDDLTESREISKKRPVTVRQDGLWRAFVARLPFTDTEVTYVVKQHKVKIENIKKQLKSASNKKMEESAKATRELADSIYTEIKHEFLKQMDRVDDEISKRLEEIKALTENKELFSHKKKKMEEDLKWFEDFSKKLNSVLDID